MIALLLLMQSAVEQAESALRQQNVEAARVAASRAVDEQPESVRALTVRGRVAMADNDFELARRVLGKAASLEPEKASTQFLLGFCYYVDNDFVRARPVLEKARKLAPKDAQTLLFLALTYDGLALPDLARPVFEETLRLQDSAAARLAYGRMLYTQGQYADAQVQITRALRLDAGSRDAHYEQARLHFVANRFGECIAEAKRALELPGDGTTERSIYFLLSRAYERSGDKESATDYRRRFEAIPPRLIR